MSKAIKPENLGDAISQQLTIYADHVEQAVQEAAAESMDKLVKLTKATRWANVKARSGVK